LTTVCPNCGTIVQTKRPLGTGRDVDPNEPMGPNEQKILDLVREMRHPDSRTVRQILAEIYERERRGQFTARVGRRTQWSYVLVQTELSNLVGRGLVEMMKLPHTREFAYRIKEGLRR